MLFLSLGLDSKKFISITINVFNALNLLDLFPMLAESELIREGDEDSSEPLLNSGHLAWLWLEVAWPGLPRRTARVFSILQQAAASLSRLSLPSLAWVHLGTSRASYLAWESSTTAGGGPPIYTLTTALFSPHPIYTANPSQ